MRKPSLVEPTYIAESFRKASEKPTVETSPIATIAPLPGSRAAKLCLPARDARSKTHWPFCSVSMDGSAPMSRLGGMFGKWRQLGRAS